MDSMIFYSVIISNSVNDLKFSALYEAIRKLPLLLFSTSGFGNPAVGYCSPYTGSTCKDVKALQNQSTLVWTDYSYNHQQMDQVIDNIFRGIENDKKDFSFSKFPTSMKVFHCQIYT